MSFGNRRGYVSSDSFLLFIFLGGRRGEEGGEPAPDKGEFVRAGHLRRLPGMVVGKRRGVVTLVGRVCKIGWKR